MADDYDPASPTLETDGNACKQFLLDKENFMKPEKVKSRWRRNSEMETQEFNSVASVTDNSTCINENQDVSIKSKNCPNFDNLEENLYLFARRKTKRRKEVRRLLCECTVPREDEIACGEECLNRLLMIECGSRCVTGEACSNRRFQKRQYVKTEPFVTEQKGHGLRVLEDVPRGSFIIEYVGEVLNTSLFEKRVKLYAREKETHYYFMALSSDAIIDARNKGNLSRFINHSCDPNCETQKWTVNGDLRVGFFARRDIKADEELTFDYQLQRYGREAQKCFCKSENCKGFIGLTGGDEINVSTDSIKKESKNKKLKKSDKEDKEKVLEEVMLEEEIEKLCINGLRNKEHTLILARLMVRAEDAATRQKLLDIILGTTEMACLRLFLDYHGLTILMCWMADVTDDLLKFKILEALSVLPVLNKNMLLESKVYDIVEKWANCKKKREDGSAYDKENIKKLKSCDTSDSETDNSALLDSSKSDLVHSSSDSVQNPAVFLSDEEHSSDNKTSDNNAYSDEESPSDNNKTQNAEIANLAKNLLSSWKDLKEEFRIPRRVDKKEDNCNGDKKPLEKSIDKVDSVKTNTQPLKGCNSESSCSPIDEKPQEIKVVCPNFSRKYSHSSSRIKEEKRSLFSKMQHRRKNVQKHILYTVTTHNDYKVSNNDNYNYPSSERESNLHYIYQPPPALLPNPAPPQSGICTVPPQKAPETIPPVYTPAPNNMLYPPHTENFKMPPPAFLGMPPPAVAPEHPTNIYANSNLPPPSLMNLNVNSHQPMVPMQVNVCTPSDPVYVKETQHTSNEYMYDKPLYMPPSHPPQIFQTSQQPEQQIYPVVQENGDTTSQKPRGVPKKLPPNWKTATDSDGNVYFYHAIKRESRWDPPTPEPEDVDNGTPTYDEPKPHSKRKSTTTAPADTSSREVVNNEIAKKIKELFRTKMSSYVVQCLNPYRKDDCRVAKITSNEDFKHLARKLTHFVMAKELKHCKHVEDLDANESVKFKARDYIHKYMARYGPVYRKDKCDSLGDD